jgi:hypothetical protein
MFNSEINKIHGEFKMSEMKDTEVSAYLHVNM